MASLVVARVEEERKVLDDLPTLVAPAERGKVEDAQVLVMIHRVRKSVSSVVRMIVGRVIVQRWMMVRPIRRSESLEPAPVVRGPAAILTVLVMKSVCISRVMLRISLTSRFAWISCVALDFSSPRR